MEEGGGFFTMKFCGVPFENFEVLWNGDVYLCCSAWVPLSVGNLKKHSVREIWNSEKAVLIRKSILDGTFRFCRREFCVYLQSNTLPEQDSVGDPYFRGVIDRKQQVLPNGPRLLTLDNDRTCNLWCPSCRTARFVLTGDDFNEALRMQKKMIDEGLSDAKRITVSDSGDPLASRLHMDLLANTDWRRYPGIKIKLMTNGLLFTPENWERLRRVQNNIEIVSISVDAATSDTYARVRRGGNFEKLLQNLSFIAGLRREKKLGLLELSFVVQQCNYREMKQFLELGRKIGADLVSFARLDNWGSFSSEEYCARAVHQKNHPEHENFLNVINDPALNHPLVNMGNLSEFVGRVRDTGTV